jgi:hypothetical protein
MKASIQVLGDNGYVWDADGDEAFAACRFFTHITLTPYKHALQSLTGCAWSVG